MTNRLRQAIADGYLESCGMGDRDLNAYFAHCQDTKRPFVRLERRRTHYYVEVELSSFGHVFTESMHRRALDLFVAVWPKRTKARTRFGFMSLASDRIPPEHARYIASELYALAITATRCEQALAGNLAE